MARLFSSGMSEMNVPPSIDQDGAHWYEIGWNARLTLIRRWIDEGASSPYAVIKRLERYERQFRLRINADGKAEWIPSDHKSDKGPLLPNGHPVYRPMTVRG